jgi:N-methylhydantoinase A
LNGADPAKALKRSRQVYWKERGGFVDTPCFDGDRMRHGMVVPGPAVIEETKTTVVIPPGCVATVDAYENYLVDVQG